LQHHGNGRRLSHPPCQQRTALSKAGLAYILVAFFVATFITTAAATADAIAIVITVAVVVAVAVGGPLEKSFKKIAPNIIFSVGSCICMLYDLTCQVSLKKSTHSQSYGV
jgi:hypothetical protein